VYSSLYACFLISRQNNTWQYEYTLKDHLGNSRVTFADLDNNGTINPLAEILQENHYYPFGLNQEGKWLNNAALPDTKYQYNGKELNEDLGLNWNDYGKRWYDPSIGRWSVTDMLSELNRDLTPYRYGFNNPMRFTDPFGLTEDDETERHYDAATRTVRIGYATKKEEDKGAPRENILGGSSKPDDIVIRGTNNSSLVIKSATDIDASVDIDFGNNYVTTDANVIGGGMALSTLVFALETANVPLAFTAVTNFAAFASSVETGLNLALSGTARVDKEGFGAPNSIYTYLESTGKLAVSNYVYNSEGKVKFQVDFENHGRSWPSGHGHNMTTPGIFKTGHMPENHVPFQDVYKGYFKIPVGTTYSVPLGTYRKNN
jgi:RHS repeat-associated protein